MIVFVPVDRVGRSIGIPVGAIGVWVGGEPGSVTVTITVVSLINGQCPFPLSFHPRGYRHPDGHSRRTRADHSYSICHRCCCDRHHHRRRRRCYRRYCSTGAGETDRHRGAALMHVIQGDRRKPVQLGTAGVRAEFPPRKVTLLLSPDRQSQWPWP